MSGVHRISRDAVDARRYEVLGRRSRETRPAKAGPVPVLPAEAILEVAPDHQWSSPESQAASRDCLFDEDDDRYDDEVPF